MFLRKLVSTPLIWAVFFTSINARAPRFSQENSVLFLVDENRDMRCRLTPEAVRLFSWEYLLELAGTEALALIGDPPIDDLRPCNENDVMYAKVVFPPDFAAKSGLTGSLVKAWVIIKVIGTVASLGFLAAFIYVLGIVGEENGSRAPAPPVSALDPIIAILNRMLVECAGNDVLISSQEGWFRCQLAENGGPFGPELMFSLPIERGVFRFDAGGLLWREETPYRRKRNSVRGRRLNRRVVIGSPQNGPNQYHPQAGGMLNLAPIGGRFIATAKAN